MKQIKQLKVEVTQKEIDEAQVANSQKCMVHEAIARKHPALKRIWVDKNQVRFTDPKQNVIYTFDMPALGKANILLWDEGTPIKPFSVTLRNPVVRTRVMRNDSTEKSGRKLRAVTADGRNKHADTAARGHGPVPKSGNKKGRAMRGRDRVFGQKLWSDELTKLRQLVTV